jgi:hypothetical protein
MTAPLPPDPRDAAQRLAAWTPLRNLRDLVHVIADSWRLADENRARLIQIGDAMADNSALLNEVAEGLRGPLLTSVTDLIASEKAALARVAELEGRNTALEAEDAGESAAAQAVRTAFDGLAAKFTEAPEVPDVDPLPEPTPSRPRSTPSPRPTSRPRSMAMAMATSSTRRWTRTATRSSDPGLIVAGPGCRPRAPVRRSPAARPVLLRQGGQRPLQQAHLLDRTVGLHQGQPGPARFLLLNEVVELYGAVDEVGLRQPGVRGELIERSRCLGDEADRDPGYGSSHAPNLH